MNLAGYRAWIRLAPVPTDDQCARFTAHLMCAHSWYKGPLFRGTRVTVYIDPEVGGGFTGGRRVSDRTWRFPGSEYREAHGRLAYRWGGGAGYKCSSDYNLETVDETRSHDNVVTRGYPGPELPLEITEQCTFDLYPYARSYEFLLYATELGHMTRLRRIWAGRPHPHRRLLCQLGETDFGSEGDLRRRYRKAACLEQNERLKIARAVYRLHQLAWG